MICIKGRLNDTRFYIGVESGRWNETNLAYRITGLNETFTTNPLPFSPDRRDIEIKLPNLLTIQDYKYLSVFSQSRGHMAHVLINSASVFFKSEYVIAIVAAGLFNVFYTN